MDKNDKNFPYRIGFWILSSLLLLGFFYSLSLKAQEPPIKFTLDFETGDLRGWFRAGKAFEFQPTLGNNPGARGWRQPTNIQGRYWIGMYERYQGRRGQNPGDIQGDGPTGTLTSHAFSIPSGNLSFLIGGGSSFDTRVELILTEGDPIEPGYKETRVLYASGKNSETLERISWNLTPYVGKTGRIRIVDDSSSGWGHINVDDFKFIALTEVYKRAIPIVTKMLEESSRIRQEPQVQPKYKVFFKASNNNPFIGEIVNFNGSVQPPARGVRYQFDFGDGKKSGWLSSSTLNHSYNKPGMHYAFLTVSISGRQFQSQKTPITVRPIQLILKCLSNPPHNVGEPVKFEVTIDSDYPDYKFIFHFGDDSNSGWIEEKSVEHVYSAERTYEVFAYARRAISIVTYARRQEVPLVRSNFLEVTIQKPPPQFRVYLRPDRNRIKVGESIKFRAEFEPFYQGIEYKFNFGDEHESNWIEEPVIEHTYRNPGEFQAFVIVRMRDRILAESSQVGIVVEDIEYAAYLSVDNENPFTGEKVIFEGRIHPGADNVRYKFDFGDKRQSGWLSDPVARHFYGKAGVYRAVLTAAIGERTFQSRPKDIKVKPILLRLRLVSDPPHYVGKPVRLEAGPEPDIPGLQFQFRFGDGSVSEWVEKDVFEHVYSRSGEFPASAATRKEGITLARSDPVRVLIQIEYRVYLRVSKRNPFVGEDVRFGGGVEPRADNVRYRFNFGDGEQSEWLARPMVDHFYSEPGRYRVVLTAAIGRRTVQSDEIVIDVEESKLNLDVISDPPHYAGKPVRLEARSEPDIPGLQFQFYFGDDSISEWEREKVIEYVYSKSGEFQAFALTRKAGKTLARSNLVRIVIQIEYKVDLRASKRNPFEGEDVRFEGGVEPLADNVRYRFDFGDGEQSEWLTRPMADHFYIESGSYRTALTAVIGENTFQSDGVVMNVREINLDLEVVSDPPHFARKPIKLEASPVPDIPDLQFQYHYGDGSVSEWVREKEVEHFYLDSGAFTAHVTTRRGGELIAESAIVEIEVIPPDYDVILEADNEAILSGNSVRFNGIIRPTPEQVLYQFNYGDEEQSDWLSEPVSTHVYSKPGTYTSTLTARVEEDSFRSNEVTIRVGVLEFKPRIEALPGRIKPGGSVIFRAVTEPRMDEIEYMFIFGDGEKGSWSAEARAEHTYSDEGTYPAYVMARWAQKYESMSDPILIKVSNILPWMFWAAIGLGALIIFGGGAYFSSRIIKAKAISKAKKFMLQIEPKKDLGIQSIKIEKAVQSSLGVRIKPVIDKGNQKIHVEGTLIIPEIPEEEEL